MEYSSDELGPIESLLDADAEIGEVIEDLVSLAPPEELFSSFSGRPPYGAIAVEAMKRLDYLLQHPELVEEFPKTSLKIGEEVFGPSSEVSYKVLLVSLTYYSVYCLERVDDEDGENLTDALGLAMKPLMFEAEQEDGLVPFSFAAKHAISIGAAAYWLHTFSKPAPSSAIMQYNFLRPIAGSAGVLLSLSDPVEPVFSWGISLLSRHAGKIILDCTSKIGRQDLLDYASTESNVNISRLVRLARNDAQLHEALGAQLYTEFEKQLMLLFQSFGYLVSHTRRGQRRIDLVVAASPPHPYTFLVEAKCCRSTYSLPTADERALRDYIATYRQASLTLPELKFVVIVSSRPSRTIGRKLMKLSSSEGIPFRFVEAEELARLRRRVRGAIPSGLLLDSLLSSEPILDEEWVESIAGKMMNYSKLFDLTVTNVFGELPDKGLPWHTEDRSKTVT
jgi:hypothetical protein